MSGGITTKIKEWVYFHIAGEKVDFMSLNRLRLNLSATSTLPDKTPYTVRSQKGREILRQAMEDTSLTFDTMKIVLNPYGQAPLTAVAVFHTEKPCFLSYTVAGHSARTEYSHTAEEAVTSHFVPIFGLYPDEDNGITLTLTDTDSKTVATRSVHIKTAPLPKELAEHPETSAYPFACDDEGVLRYYLSVPADNAGPVKISQERYLLTEKGIAAPTLNGPQPTHLHELNLLGCFYRTYYIAAGIRDSICEKEPDGNLLVLSNSLFSQTDDTVLEINRQTGAVVKTYDSLKMKSEFPSPTVIRDIPAVPNPKYLIPNPENNVPYSVVGWLNAPSLYQGASIETTDAATADALWEKYKLRFSLSGDTLLVDMGEHPIQEILLAKIDRIYQLDMTPFLAACGEDAPVSYTLAVPFTEMYSGTYSIILRFADGGQEVLADTITLSRTRKQ